MFRNCGIGNYGDYHTPERVVPGDKTQSNMPWMVIYPLGTNFSYEGDAAKHKGAKWVIDNLADSVAKGGNFMVGIGPDGTGRFHPTAIAQLEEVGAWLKINGEGIYDTHERSGNLWKEGDKVRFTEREDGKYVYALLLSRPGATVELSTVKAVAGSKISLLGHEKALAWSASDKGLTIQFPDTAKQSLAYVLKIEVRSKCSLRSQREVARGWKISRSCMRPHADALVSARTTSNPRIRTLARAATRRATLRRRRARGRNQVGRRVPTTLASLAARGSERRSAKRNLARVARVGSEERRRSGGDGAPPSYWRSPEARVERTVPSTPSDQRRLKFRRMLAVSSVISNGFCRNSQLGSVIPPSRERSAL